MVELWQFVVGIVAVIATVATVAWRLSASLEQLAARLGAVDTKLSARIDSVEARLTERISRLEGNTRALIDQMNGQLRLISFMITAQHRRQALTGEELSEAFQSYGNLLEKARGVLALERTHLNPLSREEVQRLEDYIDQAQAGRIFTREQAEDYNFLVRKLERERPEDPNLWPLLVFGGFLLGLYLGSQNR